MLLLLQSNAFGCCYSSIVNGSTSKHSMRLINTRFSNENKFFGMRASTLENQVTQPIQDHIEMGFSGTLGDGNFSALITKLQNIGY
jgi:cytochrome c peroxidase